MQLQGYKSEYSLAISRSKMLADFLRAPYLLEVDVVAI